MEGVVNPEGGEMVNIITSFSTKCKTMRVIVDLQA